MTVPNVAAVDAVEPARPPIAIVSVSGGKDSNATAIIASLSYGRENVRLVHADTGHENPITERYVRDYLPTALGMPIDIVRADFTADIARKRAFIAEHWEADGVPADRVVEALRLLVPTNVPFLDLCMMKGRFPSRKAQFCTEELKRNPLDAYTLALARQGLAVESWQGVRRDESMNRRAAPACERSDWGWWIRRPIVAWTAAQTFDLMRRAGIEPNPLYAQGMGRVGCSPCINVGKDELLEWSRRWPEEVDRVAAWERLVCACSKQGFSSLLHKTDWSKTVQTREHVYNTERIEQQILWAATSRGGKQFDLERAMPRSACSSVYGLCE